MASTSYSGSGPYTLIDRLAEEFAERFRRGERPSLKEFIDRHPELADEIQELFPALARLGQAEEQLRREESDDAPRPALHRLGDYRIVREIGRGGMGVVYEAEQVSLGRRVALKILPHHASQDRTSAERFRREARSAARLHHTNIVPVFEVGQDGDINFYAMQLIRGQGLDAVIAELRRLRALPPSGGPTPSIPAAQSAIVGPPAGEATLPGPPAAEVSQMARSLLTGRFVHGGAATTTIDESVRPGAWAVEPNMAAGGGGSGPVPGAEGDGLDASDPPPSRGRESVRAPAVPGRTDSSAVLPGGSQLSSPRHKQQRPFYRSVAHVGLQASQALAYAHARGILHRDIKPSNLLLDAAGVVWVADFGLAKADDEGLTRTGDLLGTPRYMAPERFRGEGDARADLYALGLTLYEMLTLRPAFESSDRLRLIERIKSEEPTRPRSLDARIPRDLETIVAKATEKDPRRRYGSADELAEDLRRFLGGEPIRARRVGEAEKAWKWARRRPALSATLALLAASMVAGTAISVTFAVRANRNAMKATERASATRLAQAEAEEARDRAERFERAARLQSAGLLLDHGLGLAGRGEVGPGLFWMLEALRTAPADDMDLRRVIRVNLAAWGRRLTRLRAVIPCESVVQGVAIRPDGSMIASGHADDRVRRWDPLTGREIGPPLGEAGHREGPFAVHFSPDGGTLFAAHADRIQRYDPATGERMGRRWDVLMTDEGATTPGRLLIRPDGGLIIATAGGAARFAYLDPRAEGLLDASVRVQAGEPGLSRFLPDNRLFVVREAKGEGLEITLWDSEGRRRLAGPWTSPPGIVTVSPDGRSYYRVSSIERSGRFWIEQFDMATGRAVGIPTEIPATRQGPIWTPDGRVALLVNGVGRVRVFVPIDATVPDPFRPLDERAVAVSPTGRWFVVARTDHLAVFEPGDDWTDTIAQLAVGPAAAGVENETPRIAASPDRTTELLPLCVEPGAVEVVLREADSGRPIGPGLRIPVEGDAPPITAVFSPSGRLVAVASGMTTRLLDAHSGASIGPPLVHDDTATCLAFSPDGDMLAVGHPGGGVGLWDVETGRPARAPLAIPGAVREVEFFPGGRLAIRSDSARPGAEVVRLWDSGGGRPIGPEIALDGDDDLVYSPDGDRLMRLGKNTVRFVETRTGRAAGEPHQLFREHIRRSQGVSAAAFAGDRLGVIGTGKGTIRLFDATSGRPIPGMEMSHPGRAPVLGLAVSPDGRSALTGHLDGTACLWDLTTSRAMGPPIRACREVVAVAFSPDGRWAMLISPRGRTWRWPVPGPIDADPDLLGLRLELETGVRLAPGPTAVELTARQWLERRDRLMSLGADPSSPLFPRPEDLEWHAFRAFEANEADAIETAAWHLEVLSRLRPGDWTIPARIGAMLADAGRPGRASAVIDRAEADAEAGEVASWYRLRALEALASRRFEAALRDLDRALARVPDDARALADRALSRSALGDDAGADADTALAVALAEDGDLLVLLGSRLAAAGRWEEARVPFARAVATAPLTHFERERAALTLLRAGDSEAFRLLVDRLIEALREPQASPTRLLVEARPGLLGPTNPEQAGRISAILDRECGRLARRPDVPAELRHAIHSAAGAALYRAGRHAEAVDRLEEGIASEGGPASPMDLAFLAMAHQALGRRDLARRHLDRLDGAEPTHDFWDAQEYWTLRREAESVIRPDLGFPGDPFDRD